FLEWKGEPLWWHSAKTLAASPPIHGIVFVFPAGDSAGARADLRELEARHSLGVRILVTEGGARRQDSVRNGLDLLPRECGTVLIHDSARPFLKTALATRLASAAMEKAADGIAGVIPGIPVSDTIKQVDAEGIAESTPPRAALRAVQTPQAFPLALLRDAHRKAEEERLDVTDDAMLMEHCGLRVLVIEGDPGNIKITNPGDLDMLRSDERPLLPCCGYGYDVHAYGGDRPLVLGGVPVGGEFLVKAHSDGDVLLHALMDAILGCIGGGDIGRLFPDTDPAYDNAASTVMLETVLTLAAEKGLRITHADMTVIAQKPKLAPSAEAIRRNVARLLGLAPDHVGFKATTEEHLGFTGELKGIKAVAVVSGLRI
ncbi:MAG: 2-C-methyl-D-erythritol 4-phosphate cytidylyltransferase, partial [Mailhella sp.]|nr:2-C-methyl-D-erythritol 4-phosphate cytidylyltransferase [Mailhella sp.]